MGGSRDKQQSRARPHPGGAGKLAPLTSAALASGAGVRKAVTWLLSSPGCPSSHADFTPTFHGALTPCEHKCLPDPEGTLSSSCLLVTVSLLQVSCPRTDTAQVWFAWY